MILFDRIGSDFRIYDIGFTIYECFRISNPRVNRKSKIMSELIPS